MNSTRGQRTELTLKLTGMVSLEIDTVLARDAQIRAEKKRLNIQKFHEQKLVRA